IRFGGVIFTRSDRKDINTIEDIKKKSFMAVNPSSFGGYLVALRELKKLGITPYDFSSLTFGNTHDKVVYAVLNKEVDAGTVRSDTLERMASEGKIKMSDFYILNQKEVEDFPFVLSTPLYPEWPFAKLKHTDDRVTKEIVIALLQLKDSHPAAQNAKIYGWSIPLNYQNVHEALMELKISPYDQEKQIYFEQVIQKYWYVGVVSFILLIILIWIILYFYRLNRTLQSTKNTLQYEIDEKRDTQNRLLHTQEVIVELNAKLEEKIEEQTHDIQDLLYKEKYLSNILKTIGDINQIIIVSNSLEHLIRSSCDRLIEHENYKFCWIGRIREDSSIKISYQTKLNEKFFDSNFIEAKDMLKHPELKALNDNRVVVYHPNSDFFDQKLHRFGLSSFIAFPLKQDIHSKPFGMLSVYSTREDGFEEDEIKMLQELSGDLGFAINSFLQKEELIKLERERVENYESTILSFVDMIEKRDTYTVGHTSRVAQYSKLIAQSMGFSKEEIDKLEWASNLHDIGKIVIPDSILLKPNKLNKLEYEIIQSHVTAGADMLGKIDSYKELTEIMRHHHERYDGKGYPNGLKGNEIPMLSHIMILADAFDAMTTNRIYKKSKSLKDSLQEIKELSAVQFHPKVVDIALEVFKDVEIDTTTNQLPTTKIEEERMAYFYKDQLTSLYNVNYLKILINQDLLKSHFRQIHSINLKNFSQYNRKFGWESGNELLIDIANYLAQRYQNTIIFRIQGDYFIILSSQEVEVDYNEIVQNTKLQSIEVDIEMHQKELQESDVIKTIVDLMKVM
ncbi:MAG: PhnD/SsuA/transferrin family substrate-binding protein, partial [Campylobacterota bacterium]|nr:PhnD/SsuA/transferrin family substrate-binding protein [Campylobacterota bacterium]